ncbi:MAG: hypothetical protein K6T83_07985 [Alicyclobacillus sp.]|nr:hypothetical protein [Alicyclobacillus sp.]
MKAPKFPEIWMLDRERHTWRLQNRVDELGQRLDIEEYDYEELTSDEQVALLEGAYCNGEYGEYTDYALAIGYQHKNVIMLLKLLEAEDVDSDFEKILVDVYGDDWRHEVGDVFREWMESFAKRNSSLVKFYSVRESTGDEGWFVDCVVLLDGTDKDDALRAWKEFLEA